ncbi:MAG: hypothetical protein KKE02_00950 [Alphaproteobacteria bacterium]|nr:hypothetical protein [Alphaproteobacteria bacterium]MBU1515757.1 hypothetical protein [Alphaproteobacteria bacterium]MBU2097040.1 hypothetical protein [Alphaproteobacteria bacterium]MBU2149556.1 hypothetical protein [Alphaproteobacteria bacterium]MBU2308942.1 hypothetical protein [Alphaproteobacteria bacterium]
MPSKLKSYVAIDIAPDGQALSDAFEAPHDTAAARRAQFAAQGDALQLWRDAQLIGAWRRTGPRTFERETF